MITFNDSSSSSSVMNNPEEEKKTEEKLAEATLNLLKNASVSSLIYGYLKSKDIKLSDMSVADFKQIENDIIKILVTEINLDGLQIDKDNLTFTALVNTIRFFFSLFTLEEDEEEEEKDGEIDNDSSSSSSTFFFEDI